MEKILIQELESCETESRSLIRQGKIPELEPVMRRWENALSQCQRQGMDSVDFHYFFMVFHQLNGALYQSIGQTRQMTESFLSGEEEAARCVDLVRETGNSLQVSERLLQIARNCRDFFQMAASVAADSEAALRMACRRMEISDWLWPVLDRNEARAAAEGNLQVFSLYTALGRWKEGISWAQKAADRYEELYRQSKELTDLCSGWKAEMSVFLQSLAQEGQGADPVRGYLEKLEALETDQMSGKAMSSFDPAFWQIQALTVMALAALGTDAYQRKRKKEAEADLSACCRKAEQAFQMASRMEAEGAVTADSRWQQTGNEIFQAYLSGVMIWGKYCFQEKRYDQAEKQYLEILRQIDRKPFGMQPAMQLQCRVQIYTELGQMALETGEGPGKAAFYYTHAAQAAWEGVKICQTPQMLQAATLALLGASEITRETNPAEADGYGRQGLELCDLLEKNGGQGFKPGEIHRMRKEFEKTLEQKPGILGRLFGKRKK